MNDSSDTLAPEGPREPRRGEVELRFQELSNPVPCRSCEAPIVFRETEHRGRLPLSIKSARIRACPDCLAPDGTHRSPCSRCGSSGQLYYLLAHFADCPDADRFRKKRRKRPG